MAQAAVPSYRIPSLDLLKGLVMVIMALDHVRDYFHAAAFQFDPTNLALTTPAIFATRWITHFCAPVFSLLAGLSAYLAGRRKTKGELAAFLLKRGLWLILLEVSVIAFGWMFNPGFPVLVLIVIWALGISMVVLAGLVWLPMRAILAFSLVVILGHNLLDGIPLPILHDPVVGPVAPGHFLVAGYPILPWIAVMSLGYTLGPLYASTTGPAYRRRTLVRLGLGSIALFGLLIAVNAYGDPAPWHPYPTLGQTVGSILDRSKYPPSLQYLLMTLGPAFLAMAATEKARGPVVRILSTYGRVPFLYYILHIYLLHALAMVAAQATGFGWDAMVLTAFVSEEPKLNGYGFSLPVVYGVWVLVVALLYPLCVWFDGVKQRNRHIGWLSYL